MKKIASILLVLIVILTACSSPEGNTAGAGSSALPETSETADVSASQDAADEDAENASAEDETGGEEVSYAVSDDEGGFVSAETSDADAEENDANAEENDTDAEEDPDDADAIENETNTEENDTGVEEDDTGAEEEEDDSGLVILGEAEKDYSRAAKKKKTQKGNPASSALYTSAGETAAKVETPMAPEKDYTVMVYIVGSNLESRYGAATNDMEEMRAAGIDYDKTNLLVYTGGSKRWVSDIPNTSNSVLDMSVESSGQSERIKARTEVSADMGSPESLAEFISYCTTYYPAEHYGLILWDHGGGPLWGYGSDELFQNDSLLLEELRAAMDSTVFGNGKKLDWVGFDACLMGTIENAKLWGNYAGYLVGSEELEPGRGWDYTFLNVLNHTNDAQEIVCEIVDSYGNYYDENRSQFFNPDVTLAAMDLSKTGAVIEAADALFAAMKEEIGKGSYAALNRARSRTKAFGLSAADTKEEAYDMLDLRDFAREAEELFPKESGALTEALDGMILRSASNVEGSGGVSIYLPGDNRELYGVAQELYAEKEMLSGAYKEFVSAYTDAWQAGSRTDWTLAGLKKENGELTLQLTQEQAQNASEIYYSILFRNGWGDYQIATCNVRIRPDENNILHIPGDPLLVTAQTDLQDSKKPWACLQVSDNEEESVYKTVRTLLSAGHEFTGYDLSTDEEVSVSIRNKKGETETTIQDITSATGSAWLSGKGSIDVSGYRSIIDIGGDTLCPVRDENGRMKPYSEWEYKGYLFVPLAIDDSFRFYLRPASEFDLNCICQVTVRDVNGNLHGSDFADLAPDEQTKTAEVETEKGKLYFDLFEDHAEVKKYEGEDTEITVPAAVSGKPVTAVAASAFSGCKKLRAVTLPDSIAEIGKTAFYGTSELKQIHLPAQLKSIGMSAFRKSGIEEIELPEGLERIGRAAFMESSLKAAALPGSLQQIGEAPFAGCASLSEITIGDNEFYTTPDGVLYTKDGKRLLQYPGGKGGEYEVEDGTEVIGYGAFALSGIRQVTLPDTLLDIENDAFFECYGLEALELPDSLQNIGHLAFGRERETEKEVPEGRTHFDVIRIGPSVTSIGNDAFTALDIGAFEVDGANEVFASAGGFITNKAGDTIQTVPMGAGEEIVVPDGITTLQSGIFTLLDEETGFYIPDSVFRFAENVFPTGRETSSKTGKLENVYRCTLHCSAGSAAQAYASKYGIRYDNMTDPEDQKFETASEETNGGTYYYRVFANRAEVYAFTERKGQSPETLEIPSQYEGLPVTALRYDEDANKDKTNYTFGVKKLVIPETVRSIDAGFLSGHWSVAEYEVSAENPSYVTKDGVLFTKDMKELVRYPIEKEGAEYVIPDRVETLAESAFVLNQDLQKVVMPASLRVIGRNCFATCRALKDVSFNKGLREINDLAFTYTALENVSLPSTVEWIGSTAFMLNDNFGEIVLPDKLAKIGYGAFWADYGKSFTQESIRIPAKLELELQFLNRVLFERYEVDPKSTFYSEQDGILMSKDGKKLVSVPTLREGELYIPEGTLYISYYALNGCDRITDIYLPDSLLDIGNVGEIDSKTGKTKFVLHCHEGSEAQKKLDAKKIPWVPM